MKPTFLKYLKLLCWHTQGRYDNMKDNEILEIYERGIIIKPIYFDIQDEEIRFIMNLNKKLGGLLHEEQVQAIKTQCH